MTIDRISEQCALGNESRKPALRGEPQKLVEKLYSLQQEKCFLWPYGKDGRGYGHVRVGEFQKLVHRLVCERTHGPSPSAGHEAAHVCGISSCVNPKHLRWATASENQLDRVRHDTHIRGTRHPHAKLTDQAVIAIRTAYAEEKVSQTALAKRFGVDQTTISRVIRKAGWAWLKSKTPPEKSEGVSS